MHTILRIALGFCLWKFTYAACGGLRLSKTFEEFDYFASSSENCTWTFTPPKGLTDFALIVKLSARSYDFKDKIYLPDGELLPRKNINRGANDACRKYVFSREQVKVCGGDLIRQYCPRQMSVAKLPARLTFEIFSEIFVDVSYAFISCTDEFLADEVDKLRSEKSSMLIVIVVLAFMFVLLCIGSIYLFKKYRRHNTSYPNQSRTTSLQIGKNIDSDMSFHNSSVRSDALPKRPQSVINPYSMATESNTYEELKLYSNAVKSPKPEENDLEARETNDTVMSEYVNGTDVPNVLYHTATNDVSDTKDEA